MSDHELWNIASHLRTNFRYVDLTHAFFPGQPKFSMLEDQVTTRLFTVDEQGFTVDRYEIVGQWGTHVDPPIHFVNDARTLDELPVDEMILPLAVLDLHKEAEEFHNLAVTVDHIKAWEERNGRIPDGAFVALRTDWSKRWETDDLYGIDAEGKRPVRHRRGRQAQLPWLVAGGAEIPAQRARRGSHRARNHRHGPRGVDRRGQFRLRTVLVAGRPLAD